MVMRAASGFLFLLLTALLISCKKENSPSGPPARFGFKANNAAYSWNFEPDSPRLEKGARLKKATNPNTNAPIYVLDGWSFPEGIRIECVLNTSSLAVSTYKSVTALSDPYIESVSYLNNTRYGTVTDDYTSVTITAISGNYASGYFGAVMHDLTSQTQELRIYNGYFEHILIQE